MSDTTLQRVTNLATIFGTFISLFFAIKTYYNTEQINKLNDITQQLTNNGSITMTQIDSMTTMIEALKTQNQYGIAQIQELKTQNQHGLAQVQELKRQSESVKKQALVIEKQFDYFVQQEHNKKIADINELSDLIDGIHQENFYWQDKDYFLSRSKQEVKEYFDRMIMYLDKGLSNNTIKPYEKIYAQWSIFRKQTATTRNDLVDIIDNVTYYGVDGKVIDKKRSKETALQDYYTYYSAFRMYGTHECFFIKEFKEQRDKKHKLTMGTSHVENEIKK